MIYYNRSVGFCFYFNFLDLASRQLAKDDGAPKKKKKQKKILREKQSIFFFSFSVVGFSFFSHHHRCRIKTDLQWRAN